MKFKTNDLREEYLNLTQVTPVLIEIIQDLEEYVKGCFKKELTITSIFREKTNDSGIHELWRAVDIRSHNFTDQELALIYYHINNKYCYDPERPGLKVLIIHDVGSGEHIHLQVHDDTFEY